MLQGSDRLSRPDGRRALALALRDFFAARTRAEMEAARAACLASAGGVAAVPLEPGRAAALEYAFNRLFVGPEAPAAPPFASVHMDGGGLTMGPGTMEFRELLRAIRLEAPAGAPDDSLACELEAYARLGDLAALPETAGAAREALQWLVAEHMGGWLPSFLRRAREAGPCAEMGEVLDCLEHWLAAVKERI